MNSTETAALLNLKQEFVQSVEPLTLVSSLYMSGFVKKGFYKSVQLLFRNGNKREDIIDYVIESFPFQVKFPSLVITLDSCRYHKLAARLFLKLFESNHVVRGYCSEAPRREKLQSLFRNLKRMVHDSQFKNPKRTLRNMALRYTADLENEADDIKRQLLADRCVAIIGVEIDAFYDSLACENEITQDEMFAEMKQLIPHTSNPLITDTIYYTRQANMNAFHGNIRHAENMLIQARTSAFSINHCLELVNMLYVEVYVKLWEFEINPSKSVLDSVMMWGRIGLESLETESEATKVLWRRMFILRMVFALLGIGNRANIIPQYSVDPVSLQEAQTLLAVIDTTWSGIEVRREMFYCVARARLNELLQCYDEAKHYIDRAKFLAVQGRFLEKIPFIDEFAAIIEQNMDSSSLYSSRSMDHENTSSSSNFGSSLSAVKNDQTNVKCFNHRTALKCQTITEEQKEMFGETNQSVPCVATGDFNMSESQDISRVTGTHLYQEPELSYHRLDYQWSSDGNDNLRMQNLKYDMLPSHDVAILQDEICAKVGSVQDLHVINNAAESIETAVKYLEYNDEALTSVGELKLSGGDLALSSGEVVINDVASNLGTQCCDSNTEAKVFDESNDSFQYLQTDTSEDNCQGQRNISIGQLLKQCKEGIDFGSVALFEDRSEGEGASHTTSLLTSSDKTQAMHSKPEMATPDVFDTTLFDGDKLVCDIDDDVLFGDE